MRRRVAVKHGPAHNLAQAQINQDGQIWPARMRDEHVTSPTVEDARVTPT
jgi:hypothetical protein